MILEQLKQALDFTNSEKAIATYLLQCTKEAVHLSSKDLATVSFISKSIVLRLCKKLGFNNC